MAVVLLAPLRPMSTDESVSGSLPLRPLTWPRYVSDTSLSQYFCLLFLTYLHSLQDPYILRNHLGSLECRLCLTLHTNEGSYLAHTQGKKHQTNLARRAAKDMKDTQLMIAPAPASNVQRKQFVKIGRPGYRVTKVRERLEYDHMGNVVPADSPDAVTMSSREGMMVCVHLPHIKDGVLPRKRFMSAWEQKKEPPNRAFQYLIVSLFSFHIEFLFTKTDIRISRLRRSPTKPSRFVFPLEKLRARLMTTRLGTGHIGIQIPSNISSSLCSGSATVILILLSLTCSV